MAACCALTREGARQRGKSLEIIEMTRRAKYCVNNFAAVRVLQVYHVYKAEHTGGGGGRAERDTREPGRPSSQSPRCSNRLVTCRSCASMSEGLQDHAVAAILEDLQLSHLIPTFQKVSIVCAAIAVVYYTACIPYAIHVCSDSTARLP